MDAQNYEEQFEVAPSARLIVKNVSGSVTLTPGEAGVIKVKAEQLLDSGSQDDTTVEIYQEGKDVVYAVARLTDQFSILGFRQPCKVHFTIEAPPDTILKVKTVSASVDVSGFQAEARIKTVSGSQRFADLSGDLEFDSVSGEIEGQRLSGMADVSSVSGRVRLAESDFQSLRGKTVSGRLEAETGLSAGPYHLHSVSGPIQLVAPTDSSCQVSATSVSGRFLTDLQTRRSDVDRRSWFVQIGEGGADVSMKTVSGRMSLVSSWDAAGSPPGEKRLDRQAREGVLTKLSQGELTVEDALEELS